MTSGTESSSRISTSSETKKIRSTCFNIQFESASKGTRMEHLDTTKLWFQNCDDCNDDDSYIVSSDDDDDDDRNDDDGHDDDDSEEDDIDFQSIHWEPPPSIDYNDMALALRYTCEMNRRLERWVARSSLDGATIDSPGILPINVPRLLQRKQQQQQQQQQKQQQLQKQLRGGGTQDICLNCPTNTMRASSISIKNSIVNGFGRTHQSHQEDIISSSLACNIILGNPDQYYNGSHVIQTNDSCTENLFYSRAWIQSDSLWMNISNKDEDSDRNIGMNSPQHVLSQNPATKMFGRFSGTIQQHSIDSQVAHGQQFQNLQRPMRRPLGASYWGPDLTQFIKFLVVDVLEIVPPVHQSGNNCTSTRHHRHISFNSSIRNEVIDEYLDCLDLQKLQSDLELSLAMIYLDRACSVETVRQHRQHSPSHNDNNIRTYIKSSKLSDQNNQFDNKCKHPLQCNHINNRGRITRCPPCTPRTVHRLILTSLLLSVMSTRGMDLEEVLLRAQQITKHSHKHNIAISSSSSKVQQPVLSCRFDDMLRQLSLSYSNLHDMITYMKTSLGHENGIIVTPQQMKQWRDAWESHFGYD